MKVNFPEKVVGVAILRVGIGETFLVDRKSTKEEGLYMKIDKSSGITAYIANNHCLAVNLQSGQLRKFDSNAIVTPVAAEVNFIKKGK